MSNHDQNHPQACLPSVATTAPNQYTYPSNVAEFPVKDGEIAAPLPPPPPGKTKSKGDGFWRGCCAALCCYCCLDACF